jgi:hypothetical protein
MSQKHCFCTPRKRTLFFTQFRSFKIKSAGAFIFSIHLKTSTPSTPLARASSIDTIFTAHTKKPAQGWLNVALQLKLVTFIL